MPAPRVPGETSPWPTFLRPLPQQLAAGDCQRIHFAWTFGSVGAVLSFAIRRECGSMVHMRLLTSAGGSAQVCRTFGPLTDLVAWSTYISSSFGPLRGILKGSIVGNWLMLGASISIVIGLLSVRNEPKVFPNSPCEIHEP